MSDYLAEFLADRDLPKDWMADDKLFAQYMAFCRDRVRAHLHRIRPDSIIKSVGDTLLVSVPTYLNAAQRDSLRAVLRQGIPRREDLCR